MDAALRRVAPSLNLIVGPGDSCKSTLLEAISLLFSPAPNAGITEFDCFNRVTAKEFLIEAILAMGDEGILKGDKFRYRQCRDGSKTRLSISRMRTGFALPVFG